MRHRRWMIDGYDHDATTWSATAVAVLNAVVRGLIMLLADHLGG